ncbi:ANTAR domain-containing response regulator [Syntrophomonas curvata]
MTEPGLDAFISALNPSCDDVGRQVMLLGGRIIVADDILPERKMIVETLSRAGYQITAETAGMNHTFRRIRTLYCDLVIVDSGIEGGKGLKTAAIISEDQLAAVLLLVDRDILPRMHQFHYLMKPLNYNNLIPAVEAALMYWHREGELREEIRKLKETLQTRKLLDKAKGILIAQMGINEGQAHRWIQKEAMNRGQTLRQVAREIIDNLLPGDDRLEKE